MTLYQIQVFSRIFTIYLDPKRLNCLKAILAILKTAQDAAAKTGKRTIKSRMSMTQSYGISFLNIIANEIYMMYL
jgi:hypothetical protein